MLVLGVGVSLITPLCVPCIALLAGLGAGYLAGVYEKPFASGGAAKAGAIAGAIGGVGALLGQFIGGIINSVLVDPQTIMNVLEQLGLPTTYDPSMIPTAQIGGGVCFGVLDIVLMAGLGALGGILWQQIAGKKTDTPSY
ncbi:MAG TPA: hypothetical protein PLN71_06855 [Anaerolineae bacterium]|nr:hypothetical protein [Anaerolineae bacterium]